MATFLIFYSNVYEAQNRSWPLQGSMVEISTLEDLDALSDRLDGSKLILFNRNHQPPYPYWCYYLNDSSTKEECEEDHRVEKLPDGWKDMRWIEVYNGYRE